jgi:hypothetical protein
MQTIIGNESQALETARPLAALGFAAALLDCSNYRVLDFIENGALPLAFDIAKPGARRHCLRVATAGVLAVRSGLKASSDLEKFLDAAFPKGQPVCPAARLAWKLHCDYDHIYHLLAARALSDAGTATRYQIPRESILKFLANRRLK